MAIASFLCAFFWIFGVTSVLGVIFGFVALGQIRRAGGGQNGKLLAMLGIILGILGIVGDIAWVIWVVSIAHHVDNCFHDVNCNVGNTGFGNTGNTP